MMQYAYSPDTGELIQTDAPADWMGTTTIAPPAFDAAEEGCFFLDGAWVVVKSTAEIDQARIDKTTVIESAYTTEKESPITYAGHTFQADAVSVELMTQVASSLPAGAGIGWYDIDNIEVLLTDVQFAELRGAILMRGQPLFKKRRTLKDAIAAATTVAEVEAISW